MKFKDNLSIPKIKCNGDVSSGFLISEDKVITTVHSIKEYLFDNSILIEIIFKDTNGKKEIRYGTPLLPINEEIGEIIALQLNEPMGETKSLECIKYDFEDQADVFTYGYPAVRENEGTLIELKLIGDNGYFDLKVNSDSIKDFQGCSGGPIIYKNFVVGVMLEQVAENGEASRIGAVSLVKYEDYFEEIGFTLFEKASDIYSFEEFLMGCTNPKISLDFFNYEEKDFEENFLSMLNTQSTIYLQGKTKEEVMGYVFYIIKTKTRHLIPKVLIVEGLQEWNQLRESSEGKIIIPNFNANEITPIQGNINIILYGEEDFVGNKNPLKLNKRTLDNMRDKLTDEIGEATMAHQLVRQCNGLYSIFKRKVFEGKNGKPKWEEHTDLNLLPALLAGSWKNNSKDKLFIERLTNMDYYEYIDSIKDITNGEDPFILHYNTGYEDVFKLANIEESWEILFSKITKEKLQIFEGLVLEVFSEIPAIFDLPVEEHYRSGLLTDEKIEYSSILKRGIIRSLVALALIENDTNTNNNQRFVDNIIQGLLVQTQNSKQWFAIAEFLPLMAEASPLIFVDFLEKEVNNPESKLWDLFESTSDGFFARNYYTHVLWSLEKLLCLESIAPKSIQILVKLAERNLSYKLSNSPLSTLSQALSGWLHVINVSLDEKIDLVEYIVETSSIGWGILEQILPDRSNHGSFLSMTRLDYRPYEFKYKLKFSDQLFKTYKAYTSIAINNANNDLEKWSVLFDKCFFIELGLYDLVREKFVQALSNNEIDEVRYTFKEKVRDIIYRHRFFKDSDWALSEENVKKIEELFNLITFKCDIYNYLHLFTNEKLVELNPTPYDRNERTNWEKQKEKLKEERIKVLKLIIEKPQDFWNMLELLRIHDTTSRSQQVIGSILASDIYNYDLNFNFFDEALANSAELFFISYVEKVYIKEGEKIIKSILDYLEGKAELVLPILKILRVDEKVLDIINTYSEELQDKYWTDFVIHWDIVDNSVKEKVWSKLIEYKNINALLRMIDIYFEKDIEKNLILLEEILSNQETFTINSQNSYLILEVFEHIYRETNSNIDRNLYLRICYLEWAYFSLIIDQLPPKYLMEELKTDSKLLASLIQAAYKSSKEEEKDIDEVKKRLGKQAWEILFKLKFCPCVDENNEISEEKLETWVKIFLDEIDRTGHEKIGRQILGECFAYSPKNEDIFPQIAVCKVFEKYYTEDVGIGFEMGIFNSRGVYWGTNGREEAALSAQYDNYARKVRIRYPKVSTELLKISQNYKRQAFRERERASYEL
ncbi:hypothetical protein ACFOZY_04270 [Chungangia koreensis]|uniref:Trypsin-like peptidase domain-containing protein n=1 Tax=Chungangia koreensis TaxID=752657 RepID=A0ABV8X2I2_9LACT